MSTNPAFSSPASASMCGPFLGRVFNHTMEFLYEQCSLHITEYMDNSVKLGVRPRISLILSYSSGRSPSCLAVSTVSGFPTGVADIIVIYAAKLTEPAETTLKKSGFYQQRRSVAVSSRQWCVDQVCGCDGQRKYPALKNDPYAIPGLT